MRSDKSPSEFFARMKKKPPLQLILDSLGDYSESDLDAVKQPLWIRTELKRLRFAPPEKMYDPKEIETLFPVIEPVDILGEERLWTGQDTYIKTDGFEYLIKHNDSFWVGTPPNVLWGNTLIKIKDWPQFLGNTFGIKQVTRRDYVINR